MARKKKGSMRDKLKGKLKDRTKESHNTRDSGGGMKNYFNADKMTEVSTWWAGKGDHIIDIIPYFAGENDPRNDEGEPAYILDIDVHRFVGPMDEMVVCLEQFNTPCPICEESRRLNREGYDYKEHIKPLKPGRRAMYNVIVRDGGEGEKKGVQIFEIAHWFMEKHLAKIAKDPRGGGFTIFSDPDDGKSISFERTGTGAESTGYSGHRFVDRPEVITDEELEAALCLDELVEIKTYEEVYEIFFGKKATSEDEPEEEEVDEPEEEEVDEPEDEGDEPDEGDEDEPEDEPEPEPEEKKKPKRGARRGARKGKPKDKKPTCPHGGVIGEDIDELDQCDDCKMANACEAIADDM